MKTTIFALLLSAMPIAAVAQAPVSPSQPQGASAPKADQPAQQGFSYSSQGRRDPFVSLLRRGIVATPGQAVRPGGLPGLSVNDVTLKGTVASRTGFVAILQGADNKTYIVRQGDKLLDGAVRNITQDAIVLSQQVSDPLSLEKQRDVRKVLRQTEEAK